MAGRTGRRAGDAALPPVAGRSGWRGARARGSQPRSRAALGPALGALRPLCEELADDPDFIAGFATRGPELRQARQASAQSRDGAPAGATHPQRCVHFTRKVAPAGAPSPSLPVAEARFYTDKPGRDAPRE